MRDPRYDRNRPTVRGGALGVTDAEFEAAAERRRRLLEEVAAAQGIPVSEVILTPEQIAESKRKGQVARAAVTSSPNETLLWGTAAVVVALLLLRK